MARAADVVGQVFFTRNIDRRHEERRTEEEDSGAWKIVDDVWSSVAHRRCEGSRRAFDAANARN
jgi:hypothetical protein